MRQPRVAVVTFATRSARWHAAQSRIASQLRALTSVVRLFNFGEKDLGALTASVPQAREVLTEDHRGFGYWLWKPLALKSVAEAAGSQFNLLMYVDVGCEINPNPFALKRLRRRMDVALDSGLIAEQMVAKERHWTKRDLMLRMRASATEQEEGQMSATWMLIRPDRDGHAFLDEWLDVATESNFHFLDDTPSWTAEDPEFIEHRHDQSIFSLLYKQRDFLRVPSDGQWNGFGGPWRGADRPIWTVRNRSGMSVLPSHIDASWLGAGASLANSLARGFRRLRRPSE